jgi:hypothetical protein
MFRDIGHAAVNLEPGQCVAENVPASQRSLSARAGRQIAQAALQAEHLPEPLDVSARQWKLAQLKRRVPPPFGSPTLLCYSASFVLERDTERYEQRPHQHRVGQRFRR